MHAPTHAMTRATSTGVTTQQRHRHRPTPSHRVAGRHATLAAASRLSSLRATHAFPAAAAPTPPPPLRAPDWLRKLVRAVDAEVQPLTGDGVRES